MTDVTKLTGSTLIAAEKVNGTDVYNPAGEKLGKVEDIMIDKISGRAIYGVLSFGGFLGMGEKHYPLPWSTMRYDTAKGGYVVNIDKDLLKDAPALDDDDTTWTPSYGQRVDKHYNVPSLWI